MEDNIYDIGVIIGRFQLDKLHRGHLSLLNLVSTNHKKVIVFLGVSKSGFVKNQTLDFPTREKMLKSAYSNIVVIPLVDMKSDEDWSQQVDSKIRQVFAHGSVMLYGGRDSFIPHYTGKFKVTEIPDAIGDSATARRLEIAREIRDSEDFRAGIIYAAYNKYPSSIPTVDIAIYNEDYSQILLGRKPDEKLFRLPGGYVDPSDTTLELAAMREAHEEVGHIELDKMEYVCSTKVDDWRYKNEEDKIITTLFKTKVLWGSPKAADDLAEVRWFKLQEFIGDSALISKIVPEHIPLMITLLQPYFKQIQKENELTSNI